MVVNTGAVLIREDADTHGLPLRFLCESCDLFLYRQGDLWVCGGCQQQMTLREGRRVVDRYKWKLDYLIDERRPTWTQAFSTWIRQFLRRRPRS